MLTDNQLVQVFELERNGAKFPIKFDDAWQNMGIVARTMLNARY